jgi:hypothetical protein
MSEHSETNINWDPLGEGSEKEERVDDAILINSDKLLI